MITKDIYSEDIKFQKVMYDKDTVYERFNERPFIIDEKQVGWIYDEKQYTIQEFHEKEKQDIWNELKYLRKLITELQNK